MTHFETDLMFPVAKAAFPGRLAIMCLVLVGTGLPGVWERLMLDPVSAADGIAPRGLLVAAHTFSAGIAVGAFVIACLPHLFGHERLRPLNGLALVTGLTAFAAAMLFLIVDLAHPERAFHALMSPNFGCAKTWVAGLYLVFATALVSMLFFTLRPKTSGGDGRRFKALGAVGLVAGLGIASGAGYPFPIEASGHSWQSGLFPTAFLVSALVCGAAAVIATAILLGRGGSEFKSTVLLLARFAGRLLIVELFVLPIEALVALQSGVAPPVAASGGALGHSALAPWVLPVLLSAVAAWVLATAVRRQTLGLAGVGALLALLGVFSFRFIFAHPVRTLLIAQAFGSLPLTPSSASMPSPLEWNLLVFSCGAAGLLFLAAFRWLPVIAQRGPSYGFTTTPQ